MTKMGAATAKASRRYKDVPVVLDGELATEREALMEAVAEAARQPERGRVLAVTAAKEELEAWREEHEGDVLIIRVVACQGSEWRMVQLANPLPKDKAESSAADKRYQFDLTGAAIDVLESHALVVDGDDIEKPTPHEWDDFFQHINPADMTTLGNTVIELNGQPSKLVFGDLLKA